MGRDAVTDLAPLATEVRSQDPDRYLSTLFAPAEARAALFALYAFDHEIAKVRWMVREPMTGLIRLQWWRDALEGIERGEVLAHPVVQGLHRAFAESGLERGSLDLAIDARERELESPPPDLPALERHLAAASGTVVRAALSVLGDAALSVLDDHDRKTLEIADRVGAVLGLLELARWLGRQRPPAEAEPSLWLPKALLAEPDPETDKPGDGTARQAKIGAIQERLADMARSHMAIARQGRPHDGPRAQLPALFPGTLAVARFRDLVRKPERPRDASAPIRLVWFWLRNQF